MSIINISSNILKYYLRNVYFIAGEAYAGKSTMVKMLSTRFDMAECGENYHLEAFPETQWSRFEQPAMCFLPGKIGWKTWLEMTPEEHYRWIQASTKESTEIEILECIHRAASGKKIIADTNIPPEVLHQISDYNHVAIMTGIPEEANKRFFDREDPEKKMMQEQINKCKDPEAALANFNAWAEYNPPEKTDWEHTGFFTYKRTDYETDTREEVLAVLAEHFGLRE
jgi:hypothetical protein